VLVGSPGRNFALKNRAIFMPCEGSMETIDSKRLLATD
jgi:hypothetical protein